MIEIDYSRCKIIPFAHQKEGIKALLRNEIFALFDEPGAGKSAQVVNAACLLAEAGQIDTVVVVAPASVRTVWADAEIGEIRKHSWGSSCVVEFTGGKIKQRWRDDEFDESQSSLFWIVTNYEILRNSKHVEFLLRHVTNDSLLVCDESSYIKNRTAAQTKAILKLRQHCPRAVILNGTPIVNSPIDLFSQMKVLDPKILGDNFYSFRAEYCDMVPKRFGKGRSFQMVVGYKNLDKLTAKCAPYVLRREKKDCMDLPPKLFTVREVALTPSSWKRYQELKKEAVMSLASGDTIVEPNAAVRLLRLAQVTSGHIGGLLPVFKTKEEAFQCTPPSLQDVDHTDLSSEKLDWCVKYLTEECQARYVIVWCRWRRERERLANILHGRNDLNYIVQIYGGQSNSEREEAITLFSSPTSIHQDKRAILLAQQHAGGHGLNLIAATECIYLSNDWSLGIRLQSEDRCHRPGQVHAVSYIDVIATGPNGERTIDRTIYDALSKKQDLSKLTTDAWRRELSD